LVPEQATTGDADQTTIDTSDTLVGDVTSGMPAAARPETLVEQLADGGQPAPATREEPHTGGRRRIGYVPDISPPSPSATPTKKQRKTRTKKGEK
jgi:hypothetical protein